MEDCGGQSSTGACWCDPGCTVLGDCCDNYEDTCGEFLLLPIAILNVSLPKQL